MSNKNSAVPLLKRDLRTLKILKSDLELEKPLIYVPDCSDLLDYLHLDDTKEQENAHQEGIRKYFLSSKELLFLPSWTYEFIDYMHRVINENIRQFAHPGGYDVFMSKHGDAYKFYQAWKSGDLVTANKLYKTDKKWVRILSLTQDNTVQDLIGNSIRKFNVLAKTKLKKISDFVHSDKWESPDEVINRTALDFLKKRRPKNPKSNRIDAMSFATTTSINYESDQFFSIVTRSKDPLLAFYNTLDTYENLGFSAVRSPISKLINDRLMKIMDKPKNQITELIHFVNDLIKLGEKIPWLPDTEETIPFDFSDQMRMHLEFTARMSHYQACYRDKIIGPIERKSTKSTKREQPLSIQTVGEMLTEKQIEKHMQEASEKLNSDETKEMVELARSFALSNKKLSNYKIAHGLSITELYDKIQFAFEKEIY